MTRHRIATTPLLIAGLMLLSGAVAAAQPAVSAKAEIDTRLQGFDAYMEQIVKDWNVPGIGVGIVVRDHVVHAKGYGFRDYMMYAGAGYVIELLSGGTWEDFVRERILTPLGMGSTVFSIDDMATLPDHGVPFTERRDSYELYEK
jgi:CubicO group peptidase (beta-lactamase class C family)